MLVSLICLVACTAPPEVPPAAAGTPQPAAPALRPLDVGMAAELGQAIANAAPEHRATIAARGLAELERGRLSDRLVAALDGLATVDPEARSQLVAAALETLEVRAGWSRRCGRPFETVMQELATAAAADRNGIIRGACAGLVDLLAADAREVPTQALLLAVVTLGALEIHGPLDPAEREALTTLASSPPGP